MTMTLSRSKKSFFSLIIILFLFCSLELVLRISGFQFRYSETSGLPDWVRFNINRWFLEYDPVLLWRPRSPNKSFHINKQGFRGALVPKSKKPFEVRILCLGDSCTWGHALDLKDTYPYQLEILLNRLYQESPVFFRVINAGVPGYSSHQGKLYLKNKLSFVQPDIVIVYFGRNDSRIIPENRHGKQDKDLTGSRLAYIKELLNHSKVYQFVSWSVYHVKKILGLLPPPPKSAPVGSNEKLLNDNQKRVSSSDFKKNILEIIQIAHQRKAEVLLLTSPVFPETTGNYNEELLEIAQRTYNRYIDLYSIFKKKGIRHYLMDDCHPTKEGNKIIANEILKVIPELLAH